MNARKVSILVAVVLGLGIGIGCQIVLKVWANAELQDDLVDVGSLAAAKVGLQVPSTDDDLRKTIIRRAAGHGIELEPGQITIVRDDAHQDINARKAYLSVDYYARISVGLLSFPIHFHPSSGN